MRIVIDLQGAQASNRHRGIGRYSIQLTQAIARARGDHEVLVVLNDAFPDSIPLIREALAGILPKSHILIWQAFMEVASHDPENTQRRNASERIREAFLASLKPDWVLVTSLFEGFSDGALTSVGRHTRLTTAVVLYDLIPLIHKNIYLQDSYVEEWYSEKLAHLRRADLLLSISNSSGKEAIEHLGFDPAMVEAIGTDCDRRFQPMEPTLHECEHLRNMFGLTRSFVMYTGGIDHRKNIEGLIRAYAALPAMLRSAYQLAIVCAVASSERERLNHLAQSSGLMEDELVLTGFVSDEDLLMLYNACTLFVFPSWHEGFGLPVLEAMRCGKAVIASNASSLPEVVGREDALFEPRQDSAISLLMQRVLEDIPFRQDLEHHAKYQNQKFSWNSTAKRTIAAMERHLAAIRRQNPLEGLDTRPRLAYVSPLPPERTGIADYSAELLPALSKWYDIDVIVAQEEITDNFIKSQCRIRTIEEFRADPTRYARVLYHFGNSHYHEHMLALLEEFPGVVVLHDFFLSGAQMWREFHIGEAHAWTKSLHFSHGYNAARERLTSDDVSSTLMQYPANLCVLQGAIGTIVHSEHSRDLACHWYGPEAARDWKVIPLLRNLHIPSDRETARAALGISSEELLVCSFGLLAPTKLNHRLLQSWLASPLAKNPKAHLVFVGENHGGEYGDELVRTINASQAVNRIHITGWTNSETFQLYLAAADIGVQLRTHSRGETSATALDCMNHGLATIVNAHGSMADLDSQSVWLLPDEFSDHELTTALSRLASNPAERSSLGDRARASIELKHAPDLCASLYHEAIENAYRKENNSLEDLVTELANISLPAHEQISIASSLSINFPPTPRRAQLLIHIPDENSFGKPNIHLEALKNLIRAWLQDPTQVVQIEPVIYSKSTSSFRYARKWTCKLLGIPKDWVEDSAVDVWANDIFLETNDMQSTEPSKAAILRAWHDRGVEMWWFMPYQKFSPTFKSPVHKSLDAAKPSDSSLSHVDGVIFSNSIDRTALMEHFSTLNEGRPHSLFVNKINSQLNSITAKAGYDDLFFNEIAMRLLADYLDPTPNQRESYSL